MRKPTKAEAKKRLDKIPEPPGFLSKLPGVPGLATRALRGSKALAKILIDVDPLNRTQETMRDSITPTQTRTQEEPKVNTKEVVTRMINDPMVKVDKELMDIINDDNIMMAETGELMQRIGSATRSNMSERGRTRKKTKTDRVMSSCLKEANRRYRTKSGKLRKGRTQADVMRLAHRLCKKEMK